MGSEDLEKLNQDGSLFRNVKHGEQGACGAWSGKDRMEGSDLNGETAQLFLWAPGRLAARIIPQGRRLEEPS